MRTSPTSKITPLACLAPLLLAVVAIDASAQDDISLVPQLLVGTSGVEPGVAVEYRMNTGDGLIIRPEAFISEDERLGLGGSVLWDLSQVAHLNERQSLAVGPRAVYHNSDDYSWEIDGAVIFGFDLSSDHRWRHSLEAIAAIGVAHDRDHDDNDIGVTIGGAYAFRF